MPPEAASNFTEILSVITNFGLGGLVFVIWYWGLRRQTSLEHLIEKYETDGTNHAEAFRQINVRNTETFREIFEAYRTMNDETHRTILLSIQIQTRLVEKLERMEATHGK